MKNKQHGFTLIELMFVVFIISILVSIAIPDYQRYMNRAKLSEVFSLTLILKKDIADYYAFHGVMPKDNQALFAEKPELLKGSYISSMTVDNGAIHVAMNIRNLAPIIISVRPVIIKPELNNAMPSNYIFWLYGNCPLNNSDKMQVLGVNKTNLTKEQESWLRCN